jgi:hypothetical protein
MGDKRISMDRTMAFLLISLLCLAVVGGLALSAMGFQAEAVVLVGVSGITLLVAIWTESAI